MTDAEYKRLKRRRWLERFLYKRLWFKKRTAMRIGQYLF